MFPNIALPLTTNYLKPQRYNATVFAYGQTGSGKTFTITGGAERYVDRGIIPRSLSMLFSEAAKRTDTTFQFNISCVKHTIFSAALNPQFR